MLSYLQAIILGILQGATELFPVSSLGHSVILPQLFGWHINQKDNFFLIFLVATHLATSLVLLGFFFKDWIRIIKGVFRSLAQREIRNDDVYARLGWLIIIGTIPAGILGLLFEENLKALFAVPVATSCILILNGIMLLGFEKINSRRVVTDAVVHDDTSISKISWVQTVKIGLAQALALLPGFSRTGVTLGAGLLTGLSHENAARFSFLLATPIIFAAAVLKLPELLAGGGTPAGILGPIIVGSIVSAGAALFSVIFLTKYFKTKKLTPFGVYCVGAGIVSFLILTVPSLHF